MHGQDVPFWLCILQRRVVRKKIIQFSRLERVDPLKYIKYGLPSSFPNCLYRQSWRSCGRHLSINTQRRNDVVFTIETFHSSAISARLAYFSLPRAAIGNTSTARLCRSNFTSLLCLPPKA